MSEEELKYKYIGIDSDLEEYLQSRIKKSKKIVKIISHYLYYTNDKILLDLGCNDGTITFYLSKYFNKTIGIDIDNSILEIARDKYKNEKIQFLQAKNEKFPLKDDSIDVIVANHVLYYSAQKKEMIGDCYRVLKKGGICYIAVTNKGYEDKMEKLPSILKKIVKSKFLKSTEDRGLPLSYFDYKKLFSKFEVQEITPLILKYPFKFMEKSEVSLIGKVILFLTNIFPYSFLLRVSKLAPTFIFLLIKHD